MILPFPKHLRSVGCVLGFGSLVLSLSSQHGLILHNQHEPPGLSFSDTWASLGPFRVGTREALWGADPLEAYGGFPTLVYENTSTFPSSLARNASVKWAIQKFGAQSKTRTVSTVQIHVQHSEIDWEFSQKIYGWSALQYQTWTRGYLVNHGDREQKALIRLHGVLEIYLNDEAIFGGDFYGFNRAPILIDLKPGTNKIDVRLIRDVRAMGEQLPPSIDAMIEVEKVKDGILINTAQIVAPDLVGDKLASLYMSVPVTNLYNESITLGTCHSAGPESSFKLLGMESVRVLPGQTRPIAVMLPDHTGSSDFHGDLCYRLKSHYPPNDDRREHFQYLFITRDKYEPHKFTFMHPSGVVSYAIIKPPKTNLLQSDARPLLVMLHGAGLEADSHQVRHSLDEIPDLEAFTLFPTGGSPWSADDWHIWGHADVIAAIQGVSDWIKRMEWSGPVASIDKVLFAGHSNGGQATWYFASHMPDLTLAAAPISGYTSIENYVPYHLWTESDPLKSSIASTARIAFKNELFIENMAHIPILQQHGSLDDNVPPYHSRLMKSLRDIHDIGSDYIELPDKGHWFQGAVTTPPLQLFYKTHLSRAFEETATITNFSIVSTGTSEMGSKFGISIDQLVSPDYLGRIDVTIPSKEVPRWSLRVSNVHRLHITPRLTPGNGTFSVRFESDGSEYEIRRTQKEACFVLDRSSHWSRGESEFSSGERYGLQRGTMDAILRTRAPFQIIAKHQQTTLAVQISRNMLQYFGADSVIRSIEQSRDAINSDSNIISLHRGDPMLVLSASNFNNSLTFQSHGICLRSARSSCHLIPYVDGIGAIYLRPLPDERLELVVWGSDTRSLQTAARLVPTLTGAGQPDFIVFGPKARWQGLQGVLALGFFDFGWNVSSASYVG